MNKISGQRNGTGGGFAVTVKTDPKRLKRARLVFEARHHVAMLELASARIERARKTIYGYDKPPAKAGRVSER